MVHNKAKNNEGEWEETCSKNNLEQWAKKVGKRGSQAWYEQWYKKTKPKQKPTADHLGEDISLIDEDEEIEESNCEKWGKDEERGEEWQERWGEIHKVGEKQKWCDKDLIQMMFG